jgi:hypothetical protein
MTQYFIDTEFYGHEGQSHASEAGERRTQRAGGRAMESRAVRLFDGAAMSRCTFRCLRCWTEGNRSLSYSVRPGSVPGFIDVCPKCRSTDVEVVTPEGMHTLGLATPFPARERS